MYTQKNVCINKTIVLLFKLSSPSQVLNKKTRGPLSLFISISDCHDTHSTLWSTPFFYKTEAGNCFGQGFLSLQQLKNSSKSELLEIPFGLNMSSIIHGLLPPFDCFYKQIISQNWGSSIPTNFALINRLTNEKYDLVHERNRSRASFIATICYWRSILIVYFIFWWENNVWINKCIAVFGRFLNIDSISSTS